MAVWFLKPKMVFPRSTTWPATRNWGKTRLVSRREGIWTRPRAREHTRRTVAEQAVECCHFERNKLSQLYRPRMGRLLVLPQFRVAGQVTGNALSLDPVAGIFDFAGKENAVAQVPRQLADLTMRARRSRLNATPEIRNTDAIEEKRSSGA